MKQEWKPEELRATSEEIRGAVMPKSITPEMVGGTLSGLTDALAEVVEVLGEIPREHVTVKVRGYDGTGGLSGAGATVWLDVFNAKGYPAVKVSRQKLTCDEEGVVEFDVPHGFKYAVFSQIAGLGASFQIVKTATTEEQSVSLWNLPIGVYILHYVVVGRPTDKEDVSAYDTYPFVSDHIVGGWAEYYDPDSGGWPCDEENGEWQEDAGTLGVLVSTADTSFVMTADSKSSESMMWCSNRDYRKQIPGLPMINNKQNGEAWEDCQNRARADMDGNMNTAIILDYCHNPIAANFCANQSANRNEQRWLPSAGQASLMQLNRTAINSLMQLLIDEWRWNFVLLPDLKPGSTSSWTHTEWWWTSTIYDEYCSWAVNYNGTILTNLRDNHYDVRAVSAFHFEY